MPVARDDGPRVFAESVACGLRDRQLRSCVAGDTSGGKASKLNSTDVSAPSGCCCNLKGESQSPEFRRPHARFRSRRVRRRRRRACRSNRAFAGPVHDHLCLAPSATEFCLSWSWSAGFGRAEGTLAPSAAFSLKLLRVQAKIVHQPAASRPYAGTICSRSVAGQTQPVPWRQHRLLRGLQSPDMHAEYGERGMPRTPLPAQKAMLATRSRVNARGLPAPSCETPECLSCRPPTESAVRRTHGAQTGRKRFRSSRDLPTTVRAQASRTVRPARSPRPRSTRRRTGSG